MEAIQDWDLSQLPHYSKIFETIIQLDQTLQENVSPNSEPCFNDVFSVIQKAYWKLYLEQNEKNLSQQQKNEIHFYMTSKIGKSLDSELSKTKLENNKVPKWFLYKGNTKKGRKRRSGDDQHPQNDTEDPFNGQLTMKSENSLKAEERDANYVDPYHANIKLEAENGLPELSVIYKFFSINTMLRKSVDMMDIEKITILHRKGNTYDKESNEEVEHQKEKFRNKFKLYAELIRCFEHFGYGARLVKKHSKEKITGIIYQYAVVHISKITFKLLEKYVMNFINKKTKYTPRARLQKIAYNMWNLPHFFTPELKANFIKILKIVFDVEDSLPVITKTELHEFYQYLIRKIEEKEKNPENFKNEYMIKLENPTFYNVRKQLREKVKQESDERKRLGIKNKGRKSKAARELNELKKSLAEEEDFFQRSKLHSKDRSSSQEEEDMTKGKREHKQKKQHKEERQYKEKRQYKQKHKKPKKQYSDEEVEFEDDSELSFLEDEDMSDQEKIEYFDSDEESPEIRDYFKRKKGSRDHKSKSKKKKKSKRAERQMDFDEKDIYEDFDC